MKNVEWQDEQGQLTIFEVLALQVGDQVRAVFYDDEMPYVSQARPDLLEVGKIVDIKRGSYYVAFGAHVEVFDKEKLVKDSGGV